MHGLSSPATPRGAPSTPATALLLFASGSTNRDDGSRIVAVPLDGLARERVIEVRIDSAYVESRDLDVGERSEVLVGCVRRPGMDIAVTEGCSSASRAGFS